MKTNALDAGLATGFAALERGSVHRDSGGGSGFAGLLDSERQRLDASPERRSAFDVPAANTQAAQAERRQIESRRAQAQRSERSTSAEATERAQPGDRPRPAQAKPGAEPTPQRAGAPSAKRPESASRDASQASTAASTDERDAAAAEASDATNAADAADPADTAAPRTALPPESPTADAASRWSSTLALQLRPEAQRVPAAGEAGFAAGARTTVAIAGHAGVSGVSDVAGGALAEGSAANEAHASSGGFDAALIEATHADEARAADAPASAPLRAELAPLGLVAPAVAAPTTAAAAVAAPAQASLPAPMGSPAFGEQLGFQLASFVYDGVQQAQLQLNPAEMGPVAVHITLEGNQAQIDFAAAQQRTREVLEAHWPALAAALHGAGFTLGGGGVFEQRSQQGDAQGAPEEGSSRRGTRGIAGLEAGGKGPVVRAAASGQRGLLDLYA